VGRRRKNRRAHPPTDDELWVQWRADIDRIYKETVYAFRNRLVFREVLSIARNNERLRNEAGFFFDWLRGVYGRDQAVAVRREADDSLDAINLVQLMRQMTKRPEVMSRARYKAHFPADTVINAEMQDRQFNDLAGGADLISKAVIGEDRKRLIARCEPVVTYVSKMVAHRTPATGIALTIAQIDEALDAIEEVFQKYYVMLTGRSLLQAEPAIQFDWESIFTYPWVTRPPEEE
jgi:hypothetical protein